mgnify:FL=1
MLNEIDLGGLFFPPLLLCGILAIPLTQLTIMLLVRRGLASWIWHKHLFNTALFTLYTAASWWLTQLLVAY